MKSIIKIIGLIAALLYLMLQQSFSQDIYSAIEEGKLEDVKKYLQEDPGLIDQRNQELLTPLNLAAEKNQPEIAAYLLNHGADPTIGDRENSQPIHLAAISGSTIIIDMLLEKGVDIDTRDLNLMTPLMFATSSGQLEMSTYLVGKGADVKASNISGMGVVHYAAISGNEELLKMVLKKGAQVNARSEEGYTPLHLAVLYGKTNMVAYLVEDGGGIEDETENGVQPLALALGRNSYDAAAYLISKGADVNHRDKDGFTALHDAAGRGNIRVSQLLIDNGADINAASVRGFVPLTTASWSENSAEITRLLILNGAEVNPDPCKNYKACTCGPNFETPLHLACEMGRPEMAEILVLSGAKINLYNENGQTPLHCAVKCGKPEIVKLLLEHGAFVNVADKNQGWTELHFAAAMGYGDIAVCLAENGSCPDMKDKDGRTPLDYAFYYGHNHIGYELLAAGGNDSQLSEYISIDNPLQQEVAQGEAKIWFLGHSGWAIKTSQHFLVFDYFDDPRARKADDTCLLSGYIDMKELKDQNLTVFSTHGHPDHYSASFFTWRQENPETEYVFGFQPDGPSEPYTYLPVNTEIEMDGMKIYSNKSTDQGGGFLVEVDGLVIFHMGDLANGEDFLMEEFTHEIDLVAAKNKQIDILFGPIRGCSLGTPEQVKAGTYYAIGKLQPAVFVPMHSGAYSSEYRKFAEQAAKDKLNQPIKYPMTKGDRFNYVKGEPVAIN